MNLKQVRDVAVPIIGGLLFFLVLLYACMATASYNIQWTPGFLWYPIPVLVLVIVPTLWVQSRWNIGLTIPPNVPWARVYAFAIAISIATFTVSTLQGSYNGFVRGGEGRAGDVGPLFVLANAFVISLGVAALAEVAFRGIMQTWLQKAIGMWSAILVVAAINTLAHRWEGLSNRWLGIFVGLTALGYLRSMSGSLVPPLVAHMASNFLLATGLWLWGPWDLGAMGVPSLVSFAVLGLIAFAVAIYFARSVQGHQLTPRSTASN